MIKNSKNGNSTLTGKNFEKQNNLIKILENEINFSLKNVNKKNNYYKILHNNKEIGLIFNNHALYSFLRKNEINWKDVISSKLLPDQAIYLFDKKTINIIEIKYQEVSGSVDEKLQTCDFKKKQYQKLFKKLDIKVEYIFLLNEWFKHPRYKDVLEYIINSKCKYYFNELPLNKIINLD